MSRAERNGVKYKFKSQTCSNCGLSEVCKYRESYTEEVRRLSGTGLYMNSSELPEGETGCSHTPYIGMECMTLDVRCIYFKECPSFFSRE